MADQLFLVVTFGILPFWALLVFAPRWRWTQRVVHSLWLALPLAVAYGIAQATDPNTSPDAGFHSLPAVVALFGTKEAILAGWIHFVVVDLFVGAWEVRDAQRNGIHHGFVVPCLLLTLAMAPFGLAAYGLVRLVKTRRLSLGPD
ncbi:MAG: DUF4281 domain-containing protein [Bauldia sp.]|nr:MAG: DUF4281 domain-containing protein [Bauldia sp.]